MDKALSVCFCGSGRDFESCCLALINGVKNAENPEQLMRSRYSAYASGHYPYIVETYVSNLHTTLSVSDIAVSNQDTQWLALTVIDSSAAESELKEGVGEVEFKAYYRVIDIFYCMHERSRFLKEQGVWRYQDGDRLASSGRVKFPRNSPCICGSGEKFKRCCHP